MHSREYHLCSKNILPCRVGRCRLPQTSRLWRSDYLYLFLKVSNGGSKPPLIPLHRQFTHTGAKHFSVDLFPTPHFPLSLIYSTASRDCSGRFTWEMQSRLEIRGEQPHMPNVFPLFLKWAQIVKLVLWRQLVNDRIYYIRGLEHGEKKFYIYWDMKTRPC